MTPTVLLVEDEPAVRAMLRALLTSQGLEVVGTADSPVGALPLWVTHRPDVTVIDLEIGGASGADLVRRILRIDSHAELLLYSGCMDVAKLAAARLCGARAVIRKSACFDELLAEVEAAAGTARRSSALSAA